MSLERKLDDLARRKQERIAEALRVGSGRVRLASELGLAGQRGRSGLSVGVAIEEVLPHLVKRARKGGFVRHGVTDVPIGRGGSKAQERGYRFQVFRKEAVSKIEVIESGLGRLLGGEAFGRIDVERVAFLDTETTGLAGGTGTIAFLVGLGYFSKGFEGLAGGKFVCEQFLAEDYCHEPALLDLLAERLAGFDVLVTYNGAGFDIPLLESRAIMNRIHLPLAKPHLDLLRVTRRMFKHTIGSCSLRNVEERVLGIRRRNDVPGALIPEIYFEHLRGLGRERLALVLDHNVQDIVSLGALLVHVADALHDPNHPNVATVAEAVGLAQLAEKARAFELATQHYLRALSRPKTDLPEPWRSGPPAFLERVRVVGACVRCFRRMGQPWRAAEVLEAECVQHGWSMPELFVEWAKLAERELRDDGLALRVIKQAHRQYEFLRERHHLMGAELRLRWSNALENLASRGDRIEQRIAKARQQHPPRNS